MQYEEEIVMQHEKEAAINEGMLVEKLQGDMKEFLNAKKQQTMEISKQLEVSVDLTIASHTLETVSAMEKDNSNPMLSRKGCEELDEKKATLVIKENPMTTDDSPSPISNGNQPPAILGTIGDCVIVHIIEDEAGGDTGCNK